jgi:hypothetical protein
MFVYQASLWPRKKLAAAGLFRVLKHRFERLAQILRDPEHHFPAGLQYPLFQFRHVRATHAHTPRQVRFAHALGLPPFAHTIRYHKKPLMPDFNICSLLGK